MNGRRRRRHDKRKKNRDVARPFFRRAPFSVVCFSRIEIMVKINPNDDEQGAAAATEVGTSAARDPSKIAGQLRRVSDPFVLEDPPTSGARNDVELKLGDDARFAAGGIGYWGTVVAFPDSKTVSLVVTSHVPCNHALAGHCIVDIPADKVWLSHAPGSHKRFRLFLLEANTKARAIETPDPVSDSCWEPLMPCYLHEYGLSSAYEDVRGCWCCGDEAELYLTCDNCSKARYCSGDCMKRDEQIHIYPCAYWVMKAAMLD
jgi:hypothetical protein